MLANSPRIQDLEDLRDYVSETICEQNELEIGAYPMTERLLVRGEKPCGIFFCLHGPRGVERARPLPLRGGTHGPATKKPTRPRTGLDELVRGDVQRYSTIQKNTTAEVPEMLVLSRKESQ